MGFWPVVKKVIKESDIILVILDARMPELFRNKELERICRYFKKKYFYVFNKIDLVSNENLSSLRKFYKDYFFFSLINNFVIFVFNMTRIIFDSFITFFTTGQNPMELK